MNWSLSSDRAWLYVAPVSGTNNATFAISVNPKGLASGSYIGSITVLAPGAIGGRQVVDVSMVIAAPSTKITTLLPPPVASKPTATITRYLYRGIEGNEVKILQQTLISQKYLAPGNDIGVFGPKTESAVKQFQCSEQIVCSGLPETTGYGVVGPKTKARLNEFSGFAPLEASPGAAPGLPPASAIGSLTGPFAFGYQNDQVKLLQTMLAKDASIYPEALITGYYGSLTRAAVIRFQRKHDIEQTGIAGPITREKLNEIY
jgi:peptidoglycan hydrolase-like protein with peptidoglycan-binding domain